MEMHGAPVFFTSFPPVLKATSQQSLLKIFITCQENRRETTWPCVPGGKCWFQSTVDGNVASFLFGGMGYYADMFIGVKNIII